MRRKAEQMNSTEQAYAAYLEGLRMAGHIAAYWFEAVKLRLAKSTFYTPDFLVILPDGSLEVHEVKGFWEDDARVKIKVAADLYPFRFVAMKKLPKRDGGGWQSEEF